MKTFQLTVILISSLVTFFFISQCAGGSERRDKSSQNKQEHHETAELAGYMTSMQHYAHKFALSVDAENTGLAEFYLHEIEELTEKIKQDVPTYEGYEIATLMGSFLEPSFEPVDKAVESADWKEARTRVQNMIQKCNACHAATQHGFIKVTTGFDKNPYSQDFSSK